MAKKSALLGGQSVKVEHRSGFDKSRFNALTTQVGTITPIVKQLMLPGDFSLSIALNAQLPPLANDAYLRSHLKVEAFSVPMRLCYGGFESWFCGKELYHQGTNSFVRAKLPRYVFPFGALAVMDVAGDPDDSKSAIWYHGVGSMLDYLGVRYNSSSAGEPTLNGNDWFLSDEISGLDLWDADGSLYDVEFKAVDLLNIFPLVAYHLIYDSWYRNKLIRKPSFAPLDTFDSSSRGNFEVAHLPYMAFKDIRNVVGYRQAIQDVDDAADTSSLGSDWSKTLGDLLLDGHHLCQLRQRNYGDDYFTVASPSAQEGSPMSVSTAGGSFTISALRMQNALQEFAEVNQLASPDFRQTMAARYGVSPSDGVAQKPILLGSADYPMFTKGVEVTSGADSASSRNPWAAAGVQGARVGAAYASGSNFVCKGHITEPSYLLVLVTLVPEANYATGIAHDMRLFIEEGSLVDLPCGLLEHVGNEPIFRTEIDSSQTFEPFGYVQRYLWHKAGSMNEVHGLYREGQSLAAFVPQRSFDIAEGSPGITISSDFLEIPKDALDSITAVDSGVSGFGVMIDANINLFVSEPLSESALPALSNPAVEHGRSVYLKHGGSRLA